MLKSYILITATLFALVFSGCGSNSSPSNGGSGNPGGSNTTINTRSISIESNSTKIIGYELEMHCSSGLPDIDKITVSTNELNGRVSTVLGPNIDQAKQNIKIAVMSSGTQEGALTINKAIEYTGCKNAKVLNVIAIDSSANVINDVKTAIN